MSFGVRSDDVWCDVCNDWIGFGNGWGRRMTNAQLADAAAHHGWDVRGDKALCCACKKSDVKHPGQEARESVSVWAVLAALLFVSICGLIISLSQ